MQPMCRGKQQQARLTSVLPGCGASQLPGRCLLSRVQLPLRALLPAAAAAAAAALVWPGALGAVSSCSLLLGSLSCCWLLNCCFVSVRQQEAQWMLMKIIDSSYQRLPGPSQQQHRPQPDCRRCAMSCCDLQPCGDAEADGRLRAGAGHQRLPGTCLPPAALCPASLDEAR